MEQGKLEIKSSSFNLKKNLEELASIFQMQGEIQGRNFLSLSVLNMER